MGIDPISSGLEAAGGVVSSIIGANSAQKQMDFQERMSNSAHQREVSDLKKAGLNPILSAGDPASLPPQGTSFTPDNPMRGFAQNLTQGNIRNLQDQQAYSAKQQGDLNLSQSQLAVGQLQKADAERNQIDKLTPLLVKKAASESLVNSATAQKIQQQNVKGGIVSGLWDVVKEPIVNSAKAIKSLGKGIWDEWTGKTPPPIIKPWKGAKTWGSDAK